MANSGEVVNYHLYNHHNTPTHSYLKFQYKYPQRDFPYEDLVTTNGRRSKQDMEYELLDTGIFDDDRYFDVIVEYAKRDHDDILMLVTAHNRGPDTATLHLLPTLWFRNTWSWGDAVTKAAAHHVLQIAAGEGASIRLRLTSADRPEKKKPLGPNFDRVFKARRAEADQFYATIIPPTLREDGAMVMRQALAGLLWGKQY